VAPPRTPSPAAALAGEAYERLSYPGYAYAATYPAWLEAVGRLFGLDAAPAASCRVLELGCGDGGNALSIAQSLPGARVLGLDASAGAVARGAELARRAGLENVELRRADFERLPADLGDFDYVIAHGVYSWIPAAARAALLALVRRCLAPAGIAFLSYNAYPGSYLRDMTRDVLRYHVRGIEDPEARLAAAHELMETIVAIEEPTPYARAMREQLERMLRVSDALLFHDDLAEVSTPFYLHEVVEHAAAHGLRFLSEAELAESQMRGVPESAARLMERLPDAVAREQYLDFFKNRMFRQTLLCHAAVPVRRELDDAQLERLAISSPAQPEGERAQAPDGEETFVTPEGFSLTTSEPHVRAAMHALATAWPGALDFAALLGRAHAAAGEGVAVELVAGRLRHVLLQAHLARIVLLHGCAAPVSARPGGRPRASALARAQCAGGAAVVSSLLHANVRLEGELEPALLPLLDGARDVRALGGELGRSEAEVEAALERFAASGLLSG
jgi:SAM-dependent methyltransferase